MDIQHAMEERVGPKEVILPDEGQWFTTEDRGVTAQIKLPFGRYPHFKFSAVRFDIEPGAQLDMNAMLYAGRMLYCLDGNGVLALNGVAKEFTMGAFAHVGEGHHARLENRGSSLLQVFSFVFGPSPEGLPELLHKDVAGKARLIVSQEMRSVFGLTGLERALCLEDSRKGELVYQMPDEGPSWWQAKPSAGFVEVKLAPFTANIHHYAVLMQTLFPGNGVREHGHNQLNEFFVITKGAALAALDGEEVLCPLGTAIVIGRNVMHRWSNAGAIDAQNFAIIDPPGVEGALALTGRSRTPGEDWPSDIPRNAETGRILQERFGFVIRGDAADRVS